MLRLLGDQASSLKGRKKSGTRPTWGKREYSASARRGLRDTNENLRNAMRGRYCETGASFGDRRLCYTKGRYCVSSLGGEKITLFTSQKEAEGLPTGQKGVRFSGQKEEVMIKAPFASRNFLHTAEWGRRGRSQRRDDPRTIATRIQSELISRDYPISS